MADGSPVERQETVSVWSPAAATPAASRYAQSDSSAVLRRRAVAAVMRRMW